MTLFLSFEKTQPCSSRKLIVAASDVQLFLKYSSIISFVGYQVKKGDRVSVCSGRVRRICLLAIVVAILSVPPFAAHYITFRAGVHDCLTNRARARRGWSAKTSVSIDLQCRADRHFVLRMRDGYRIAIRHAPFEMVSAAADKDCPGGLEGSLDLSPRLRFHVGFEFSSSMSSAASTTLRRTSSIVSPHVMQPGISGTVTEYPPYLSARTSAV